MRVTRRGRGSIRCAIRPLSRRRRRHRRDRSSSAARVRAAEATSTSTHASRTLARATRGLSILARSGAAAAIGTASVIVGRGTAEEGSGTAEEAIGTMSTGANRQEVEVVEVAAGAARGTAVEEMVEGALQATATRITRITTIASRRMGLRSGGARSRSPVAPRGAVLEGVRGTRMDGEIGRIRGRCSRGSGATRAKTEEGGVEEEEVEVAVAVMEAAQHALLPLLPRRRSVCFYDRRPQSLRHLRGRTRSWPLQQRRARRRIPRMLNRCCAVSSRPRLLGSSWRGGRRRSRPMEMEARRMERPSRLPPLRHPPRRRRRRRAPQTAAAQPPQRIRPPSISVAPPSMDAPSPPPRRQSF